MIYLDTHVVVWLFSGLIEKISPEVLSKLERNELRISPMVRLELSFLKEIGRIRYSDTEIIDDLEHSMEVTECPKSFSLISKIATTITWTRDPFDRIIVAQAISNDAHLLTYDKHIQAHYKKAMG